MHEWMKITYLTPYCTNGTLQGKFNYYNLKYVDILSLVGGRTGDTYQRAFNNGYFLPEFFFQLPYLY